MTVIVETQIGATVRLGPTIERRSLGSVHVRAKTAEPHHTGTLPATPQISDGLAIFTDESLNRQRSPLGLDTVTLNHDAGSAVERTGPVILQIVPAMDSGGAERTTIDISRALTDDGWTALVAT